MPALRAENAVIEPNSPTQPDRTGSGATDPRPPRPASVVLEDLDEFEKQRKDRVKRGEPLPTELRGSIHDPKVWRRLGRYIPPHKWALVSSFVLSLFSAAAKIGTLFTLEKLLKPFFDASGGVITKSFEQLFAELSTAFSHGASTPLTLFSWTLPFDPWPYTFGLTSLSISLEQAWNSIPPREQLQIAGSAMIALVIIEQINKYSQRLIMRSVSLDVVRVMRADVFRKLMRLSMRFFHANHSAKLLSRITSDLTNLGKLLVDVMVHILTDAFTVVLAMTYVWMRSGGAVILALVLVTVTFLPIQIVARKLRKREIKNQHKLSLVFQYIQESLGAQKIVKAFGAEKHEIERFNGINDRVTAGRMKAAELRARADPIVEIMGAAAVAGFMIWGGYKVVDGDWHGEEFFVIVMALITVVASLRRLGDTNIKIQWGLSSADRVATLLYNEPEMTDSPNAVELEQFTSQIEFRDVSFAHKADMPVLQDVNFTVRRGETLALVGHTGSGKSTIGDLVVRFYDVDSGAVLIDEHDVRDIALTSLRQHMAVVTQETMLFQGTVHSNIAYARPDASRDEVTAAARSAFAHDFIAKLPGGYDTEVGERGMTLSGGERQRIAIARALLSQAPILLLDEATSALDSKSERIVQDAIDSARSNHTTIIIAHRLSTIRDADQILVLENGAVVERGNHAELMAARGLYASMVRLQNDS